MGWPRNPLRRRSRPRGNALQLHTLAARPFSLGGSKDSRSAHPLGKSEVFRVAMHKACSWAVAASRPLITRSVRTAIRRQEEWTRDNRFFSARLAGSLPPTDFKAMRKHPRSFRATATLSSCPRFPPLSSKKNFATNENNSKDFASDHVIRLNSLHERR